MIWLLFSFQLNSLWLAVWVLLYFTYNLTWLGCFHSFNSIQAYDSELESRKLELLNCVQDTQRGLSTTPDQRSSIEEALVNVEGYKYNMGEPIDLAKLDGTWRLQYTSAPDVLILLQAAATLPFFQVLTINFTILHSLNLTKQLNYLPLTPLFHKHIIVSFRFTSSNQILDNVLSIFLS